MKIINYKLKKNINKWKYCFEIDDYNFIIDFNCYNDKNIIDNMINVMNVNIKISNIWDVSFYNIEKNLKKNYKRINFKLPYCFTISTNIIKIFKKWLNEIKPICFGFILKNDRYNLYKKIMFRIIKNFNYNLKEYVDGDIIIFLFYKD